jgi:hypothetical protein
MYRQPCRLTRSKIIHLDQADADPAIVAATTAV